MEKKIVFMIGIMILTLSGCKALENQVVKETYPTLQPIAVIEEEPMKISVESNEQLIIYQLNDSQAAKDLYAQLPLTLEVENFSNNEKIFYPTHALQTDDTPLAETKKGVLAYYSPWKDVVMFYDEFNQAEGLYELGYAIIGHDDIKHLSGEIMIAPYEK